LHGLTVWTTLSDLIWAVGLGTTIYGVFDLWGRWGSYRERRREQRRKLELLGGTNQFIARVTHLGGEGTSFNELSVMARRKADITSIPRANSCLWEKIGEVIAL
jgi:hypothetical protein